MEKGIGLFMDEDSIGDLLETLAAGKHAEISNVDKLRFVAKNGEKTTVSYRGQRIRLLESDVIFCSFRDITDRIHAEEEAKLIQTRLIQANKMTSLGLMVSGVAHEINNPNNYIMFNSQMISDTWKDVQAILTEYCADRDDILLGGLPWKELQEVMPKLLGGIVDGSRMITRIVGDLKGFIRHNLEGMDNEVDVNDVVRNARSLIDNQIRKYTERFHVDLDGGLPPIKGNAQQLVQVLVNLIMNALEALPSKKKQISVSTTLDTVRNCAVIKVRDKGSGMPKKVMEKAFEPFYSTKLNKGGTGLGLAISNSIVKAHEGYMAIESNEGKGTTVSIHLPLVNGIRRDLQ
jgi:signal transduction histidine kinase